MTDWTLKYNEQGDLITMEDRDSPPLVRVMYIPAKHVNLVYEAYLNGKTWKVASPMYNISREEFAFIAANKPPTY